MICNGCNKKNEGANIIHATKLPTQLMLQILEYQNIEYDEDKFQSIINKGKFSVQIYLMLNVMFQGSHME